MRQFAGYGTPEETNRRYKELLAAGGTGLSVAFDLPTLMGRDPDHACSQGEVGKCGVSVASLADMERLFDGIDLGAVTTSMTINSPAAMIFAMYLVVAERQGVPWAALSGTLQNDILKEYIAQKEYIYPPAPSMRLVTDTFAFCARETPRWNTISVSGYHIREAGATALQELAFTLRDGIEYVQHGVDAGLDVDRFAPRISFFFNAHNDFFEEIAEVPRRPLPLGHGDAGPLPGAGRAVVEAALHTQTAGVSLTAQEPHNNVVRTAVQAMAAVLGGTNSLHTNSLDEALSLPTREAALLALRTQQVIAHESGVAAHVDPLGGSFFVERLTATWRRARASTFGPSTTSGAWSRPSRPAIRSARSPRAPTGSSARWSRASGRSSASTTAPASPGPRSRPLYIDETAASAQATASRRCGRAGTAPPSPSPSTACARPPSATDNLVPLLIDAVRASATLGEMCDALRDVWGEYEEPASF